MKETNAREGVLKSRKGLEEEEEEGERN